jgi:hypothetical protein
VIASARVMLGDELKSNEATGGQILGNNSVFSQQIVNNAWRTLQEALADVGYTQLKGETLITGIPQVRTVDPGIQCWINQTGCFDGVNMFVQPALPVDMILPVKLWERPSGQNAIFFPNPMELMFDGLQSQLKCLWNGQWEWRGGNIFYPGSQQPMDFRLLYMRYLNDFDDGGGLQWFQQQVPLVRSQNAFASFICAEIAQSREGMDVEKWVRDGMREVKQMTNREAGMKQRGNVRRMSRSGRLEGYGTIYDY